MGDLINALSHSKPKNTHRCVYVVSFPHTGSVIGLTLVDMYESDDDDFVCGRAYGGDGLAVVRFSAVWC